jgi:hypothetical protein
MPFACSGCHKMLPTGRGRARHGRSCDVVAFEAARKEAELAAHDSDEDDEEYADHAPAPYADQFLDASGHDSRFQLPDEEPPAGSEVSDDAFDSEAPSDSDDESTVAADERAQSDQVFSIPLPIDAPGTDGVPTWNAEEEWLVTWIKKSGISQARVTELFAMLRTGALDLRKQRYPNARSFFAAIDKAAAAESSASSAIAWKVEKFNVDGPRQRSWANKTVAFHYRPALEVVKDLFRRDDLNIRLRAGAVETNAAGQRVLDEAWTGDRWRRIEVDDTRPQTGASHNARAAKLLSGPRLKSRAAEGCFLRRGAQRNCSPVRDLSPGPQKGFFHGVLQTKPN